jgi:subtilase family serine protease
MGSRFPGIVRRRYVPAIALALVVVVPAALATPAPAASPRYVTALLTLEHPRGLNQFVRRVSNPGSPHYRDYRSVRSLVHRFGASKQTRRPSKRWLAARGFDGEVGPTGAYVTARMPSAAATEAFPATRRSKRAGSSAGSGVEPRRVPRGLRGSVQDVALLSTRPGAFTTASIPPLPPDHGSMRNRTGTPAGCTEGQEAGRPAPASAFTPNQYLTAYGHQTLHNRGLRGQGERASLVEIDGFARSDIATFGQCFGIHIPPIAVKPVGTSQPLAPGSETTLDLEVMSAAAPSLERITAYEGASSTSGLFLTATAALGTRHHRPDVISISIEGCEASLSGQRVYWRALNNAYAVAAGAGITTLVASGDQGSSMCEDELDGHSSALPILSPNFMATSRYVTAVGGTNLVLDDQNRIKNQIAWNDAPALFGASGGGFSSLVSRPWWQRGAISEQASGDGRTLPDIAALADPVPGFAIYCTADDCQEDPPPPHPGWISIGGTSAATPLTAGGVALADQSARLHGQRSLGLIDPLLYRLASRRKAHHRVFDDIPKGSNDLGTMIPADAGGGEPLGCCTGRPGFDPVTGWGSVKIPSFNRAARHAGR